MQNEEITNGSGKLGMDLSSGKSQEIPTIKTTISREEAKKKRG